VAAQPRPRAPAGKFTYVLASMGTTIRWFSFDPDNLDAGFELLSELDFDKVPALPKEDARRAARVLRLPRWLYVRIG
jgi:hypothetical protein